MHLNLSPPIQKSTLGIGVIGCGYWGPNLIRNFYEHSQTELLGVCDLDDERLGFIDNRYPTVQTSKDYRDLLDNKDIDAVCIATPVGTHFELAMECARAGKHLLVEKPLASNVKDARELVAECKRQGVVLMVDHTFIYTAAVREIKKLIDTGELGDVLYYDSERINLGLVQADVNVLWDLAVHDLSIIQYLLPDQPQAVSATGMRHIPGRQETIAYLTLHYSSGFIAHCHVNWMSPVKVRRTLIGGSKKMVLYDDVEPSEKIRLYDSGITLSNNPSEGSLLRDRQLMVDYRKGDVLIPHLPPTEALKTEVDHFVECILENKTPDSSGERGADLVAMLEAASKSLFLKGQPVTL